MLSNVELTNCLLLATEMYVALHSLILHNIFSINCSQSPIDSFFVLIGTPKYLKENTPLLTP